MTRKLVAALEAWVSVSWRPHMRSTATTTATSGPSAPVTAVSQSSAHDFRTTGLHVPQKSQPGGPATVRYEASPALKLVHQQPVAPAALVPSLLEHHTHAVAWEQEQQAAWNAQDQYGTPEARLARRNALAAVLAAQVAAFNATGGGNGNGGGSVGYCPDPSKSMADLLAGYLVPRLSSCCRGSAFFFLQTCVSDC